MEKRLSTFLLIFFSLLFLLSLSSLIALPVKLRSSSFFVPCLVASVLLTVFSSGCVFWIYSLSFSSKAHCHPATLSVEDLERNSASVDVNLSQTGPSTNAATTAQGFESDEWESSSEGSDEGYGYGYGNGNGGPVTCNAAVIWLHGLGDAPYGHYTQEFKSQMRQGGDFDYVHWKIPAASFQPVTANRGTRMPSWFDILQFPVTLNSLRTSKEEVLKAVTTVHDCIDQCHAEGIDSRRIIVGGFSQGGATALMSAITSPRPLAGLAVLWGWIPLENEAITTELEVHAEGLTVLWSHGMEDNLVEYQNAVDGCEFMNGIGAICELHGHANQKHNPHTEEYELLRTWMRTRLPPLP